MEQHARGGGMRTRLIQEIGAYHARPWGDTAVEAAHCVVSWQAKVDSVVDDNLVGQLRARSAEYLARDIPAGQLSCSQILDQVK